MIEIQKPELERRVREQLQRGGFQDADELLEKALDALQQKEAATPEIDGRKPGRKSLVRLFQESPLHGLDLDFSRNRTGARPVDLG